MRLKAFERLSLSSERQGVALLEPERRSDESICDGSNTELGI